ncbi:hypothetical protein [Natronohydrobacter thiooxidans]|jgi:hypothetical protein|uniref:hypothetical protein n=1 Tax=Natronohydrobacter thiooxidans TaxID=87172 RepID=UPI0008FF42D6|nr:hypothetical protein [Natronohydrobacter thiooxidans]
MEQVLGIVTIVQEGRFRLTKPDGGALHFSLAHPAQTAAQDLAALCTRLAHVRVAYEKVDGRSALVAHEISELGVYKP